MNGANAADFVWGVLLVARFLFMLAVVVLFLSS
jgi:hypothetical protein